MKKLKTTTHTHVHTLTTVAQNFRVWREVSKRKLRRRCRDGGGWVERGWEEKALMSFYEM